jgi:hypothetical protein
MPEDGLWMPKLAGKKLEGSSAEISQLEFASGQASVPNHSRFFEVSINKGSASGIDRPEF